MRISEQAKQVAEWCVDEYMAKSPYNQYTNGVGITKVKFRDPNATDGEDECITILLVKDLPEDLHIVREKDGIKIYTEVVVEIVAL